MTTAPRRYFYPNAALSKDALQSWAEGVASTYSWLPADPEQILFDATKNWGKRR
jgi:hypothetical protein